MFMLFSGGRHIEDLKELIEYKAFKELTDLKIPSLYIPVTTGRPFRF